MDLISHIANQRHAHEDDENQKQTRSNQIPSGVFLINKLREKDRRYPRQQAFLEQQWRVR